MVMSMARWKQLLCLSNFPVKLVKSAVLATSGPSGRRLSPVSFRNFFRKNKTQWPWLGGEPGPLDAEASKPTTRPTYVHLIRAFFTHPLVYQWSLVIVVNFSFFSSLVAFSFI